MSFISPTLIARIYQALGESRARNAVLLLRQHPLAARLCVAEQQALMGEIVRAADQEFQENDIERARAYYELGIALYQSCFGDSHADALRCMGGLLKVYEVRNEVQSMLSLLDLGQQVGSAMRKELCKPKAVAVVNQAA
jgi:hypothetical protein